MKKKRNILMCLEQLNIGGIETAVLTLCKGYIRKGYNVYIAAKNGIFTEQLEKIGVEIYPIKYEFINYYPLEQMEELVKFCQEKKISEIHIHQYPCILYWMPVCMKLKIPYVAYVHSIVTGTPQWFMKTFPVYKTALPIFFENASKIVCIAESTRNEIDSLFHIDHDHYKIIPNSLNMEDFNIIDPRNDIKTFGIVSRLSEEKMLSIKNSIDLYIEYSKIKKNTKLLIAGDGPMLKELKEYSRKGKNIKFLGAISNIPEFIMQLDVLMGVDRCILEAIASKVFAIISSYDGKLNIVSNNNINKAGQQNFSGMNLEVTNPNDILTKLQKITKSEYEKITNDNYEYVNTHYNVDNNLYMYDLNSDFTNDYLRVFKETNEYLKTIETLDYELNYKKNNSLYAKGKRFIKRVYNKIKRTIKKIIKY